MGKPAPRSSERSKRRSPGAKDPRARPWFFANLRRAGLAALLGCALAVALINGALRWVSGGAGPHLLDPRWLGPKTLALAAYARHRPACFVLGEESALSCVPAAARESGVEPELLEALVRTESGGRAHCISERGACGPVQLLPGTARQLHVDDPFNPREATAGGARYLREQLDRFHGNRALALAAYNAGPGAVHGAVPHNGETELYVPRVLAEYRALKEKQRVEQRARQRLRSAARPRASRKP